VFLLSILDKFNKGKIKNKDELKSYIMGKCFTIISKYHRLKRVTNETYKKYIKNNINDDEFNQDNFNLHIFSKDKKIKLKMKIEDDEINLISPINKDFDDEDAKLYIEYGSFLKEMKQFKLNEILQSDGKILNSLIKEIDEFINDKLLKNKKLFLNVELINGKLRKSETIDLTNVLQQYFVENNVILSSNFLEDILKVDFNTKLSDNYSLNIMTKDVEMINLLNNQKIKLIKTNENELSYEILANDDKS
tara:strand:- start:3585 stop:4331 length:747 start_codon:yes stop_codon:yes gene_type:complete